MTLDEQIAKLKRRIELGEGIRRSQVWSTEQYRYIDSSINQFKQELASLEALNQIERAELIRRGFMEFN